MGSMEQIIKQFLKIVIQWSRWVTRDKEHNHRKPKKDITCFLLSKKLFFLDSKTFYSH